MSLQILTNGLKNVSYVNKYSYSVYDSGSWVFQCVVSYIAAGIVWLGWPDLAGMGFPLSVGWLVGLSDCRLVGWFVLLESLVLHAMLGLASSLASLHRAEAYHAVPHPDSQLSLVIN